VLRRADRALYEAKLGGATVMVEAAAVPVVISPLSGPRSLFRSLAGWGFPASTGVAFGQAPPGIDYSANPKESVS
jgi:hypothetical protein